MSVLETVIYGILIAIVAGLAFKWFIYDIFIKKNKPKKEKKAEKQEDKENED